VSVPILVVDDLRTYFRIGRGLVRAVDGVSFSVDRGATLGIVGESGSGKTVLTRSIMGLLPRRNALTPSGTIVFKGTDLRRAPRREVQRVWGRDISVVFQNPMTSLNPVMRIGKQLTESMSRHLDIGREEACERAIQMLRAMELSESERRMRQYPHELSGGMRQRVTIAMALMCGPDVLIADEPTTALDVTVQAQILDLLQQRQRDSDMAMILITHDLGVVAGRTDEILVMYAGRVVERAPTAVLFEHTRHPYTEALLQSIPRVEDESETRLRTIPGRPPDLADLPAGCKFAARCSSAQELCLEQEPPLTPSGIPAHEYRCWFPVGVSAPTRRKPAGIPAGGAD
jgi:peptide/nickel transport system ATP-binding protein